MLCIQKFSAFSYVYLAYSKIGKQIIFVFTFTIDVRVGCAGLGQLLLLLAFVVCDRISNRRGRLLS